MRQYGFMFGSHDMGAEFGITVAEIHDTLSPTLRPRKTQIPARNGAFDYGAKWYDERVLTLTCDIVQPYTRAQLRELAYVLSKKARIITWIEQDKYYTGRIYDPNEIERIGRTNHFQLTFVCDPFAEKTAADIPITIGRTTINYVGTAETPTLIIIKNTNAFAINGIRIIARRRK